MPALGIRPAISLSLKLLTFRWGKIARFALSGVKSTSCWLCAAFFWGGISDIFFRLFFLWYQRDALCTQIFGCEVETVLMLKGGFCLWGRPPLILRDIQAVSPATYEYGPNRLLPPLPVFLFVCTIPSVLNLFVCLRKTLSGDISAQRQHGIFRFHIVCVIICMFIKKHLCFLSDSCRTVAFVPTKDFFIR